MILISGAHGKSELLDRMANTKDSFLIVCGERPWPSSTDRFKRVYYSLKADPFALVQTGIDTVLNENYDVDRPMIFVYTNFLKFDNELQAILRLVRDAEKDYPNLNIIVTYKDLHYPDRGF